MGEWGQERAAEAGAEAMENEYVELAKTQKPLKGSMPRAGAPLLVKCIKSLQKPICISAGCDGGLAIIKMRIWHRAAAKLT